MPDRTGSILGRRYKLEYGLGAGAMARVWCATDLHTGERVAIKRVLETVRDPADTTARFLDEIRVTRTVEHPHVAAGLDHGLDGGPFLVLEWVDGVDAHALVSRAERLTPSAGVVVALDLTDALAAVHAHRTGVLHRDIAPGNVLLSRDGRALLADFGLARWLACPRAQPGHIVVGKLGYLPPEVLRGRVHGVRADLYGLGATLWELLSGRRLWAHDTDPTARARAWLHSPRMPLRDAAPEVPAHLAAVVDQCLAMNPAARPANARALRAALERASARDRITPCRDDLACAVWAAARDLPVMSPTTRVRRSRAEYVTVSALAVPTSIRPRPIAAAG
jgi:eukaryotic-like serine/threonine-protein kinase